MPGESAACRQWSTTAASYGPGGKAAHLAKSKKSTESPFRFASALKASALLRRSAEPTSRMLPLATPLTARASRYRTEASRSVSESAGAEWGGGGAGVGRENSLKSG